MGKNIKTNIFRMQANDSINWGQFYIEFIGFMLKDRSMLDYTSLYSLNTYEMNAKILLQYFQ